MLDSRVRFKAGTGDSNLELSAIAGRDWLIQSKADGEFRIYDEDAAAVRFNIDTSGNIQLPAYTAGYLKSDASGNITVDSDTIEDTLDSVTTRGNTTTNNITIGGLTLTGTDNYIKTDTVDGLDTKSMHILSGTANSSSRGAYVSVYGNEHASQAGRVYIVSGDKAGAELRINSVNASGFTTFFQGGSERMRVHSNGNVGIGTTSPAEILHIRNNGTARVEVEGTTGPAAFKATNNSGSYGWYVHDTTDSFRLFDFNDSADRITVDGDGNVGIGTTSPGAKLDVAGSVYVRSGNQLRLYNPVGNDWAVLNYTGTNVLNINNTITLQNSGGVNSLYPNITEATDLGTSSLKFRNGYLSGDLTIGGNVGIGTASPSEKLHVVGNVRIEGDLTVNGSYTQIDTDVNTTEQWNVTNDGTGPAVTINQTGAQDIMDVQDDGTSVFYIEDGGNVGLGTTNPTTTLDVRGDIKAEGANTPTISVKDTTNNLVGRIRAANSYVYLTADHGDTVSSSRIVFQVDGDSSAYVTNGLFAAETSVQFTTYGSGTETGTAAYALAVDSSGNVIETAVQGSPTGGSGTAGKLTKWDTSSTLTDSVITESGDNLGIGVTPKTGGSTWQHIQFGGTGNIIARKSDSTVDAMFANNYYINSSDTDSHIVTGAATRVFLNDGEIRFDTAPSAAADAAAAFTNRMFIANTGNVGIGTTSPANNLHIYNASGSTIAIDSAGGNNTGLQYKNNGSLEAAITYVPSTSQMHFYRGGDVMVVGSSNVGIGTTSPRSGYKLTLDKSTNVSGEFVGISIEEAGGTGYGYIRSEDQLTPDTSFVIGHTSRVLTFETGSTERVRIDNSGNVGIGTISPDQKLQIHESTSSGAYLKVTNSTTGEDGGNGSLFGISSNEEALVWNYENTATRFSTNGTERMRITSNGNVGIGTTSPGAKLTSISTTEQLRVGYSDSIYGSFTISSAGDINYTTSGGGDEFDFWNGVEAVRYVDIGQNGSSEKQFRIFNEGTPNTILSSTGNSYLNATAGNVGIGTTSPTQKLEVTGNTYVTGYVQASSALMGNKVINTVNYATFGSNSTGTGVALSRDFNPSTYPDLVINPSGNVGIGTASPKAALDVKGRFVVDTKNVSISENFADVLSVNMSNHTGCYVKITAFGDWGSHSAVAYLGEFFLQNGAGGYAEPGMIIRQEDNTHTDAIQAQIVDPGGTSGDREFIIQLKTTSASSTPFVAYVTYTIQGQFNSAS